MPRILIIAEKDEVFALLRHILSQEGFQVAPILKPSSSVRQIRLLLPDLLIIDSKVPTLSKKDIYSRLRSDKSVAALPILVLIGAGESVDTCRFSTGVNAFLKRPIDPGKLITLIESLIQDSRELTAPSKPITAGSLTIDPVPLRVLRSGKSVALSFLEFRLLHYLASRPETICRRDQLLKDVWRDLHTTPRTIDTCIRHVREKIEDDPNQPIYIKSVRGLGYAFQMIPPKKLRFPQKHH